MASGVSQSAFDRESRKSFFYGMVIVSLSSFDLSAYITTLSSVSMTADSLTAQERERETINTHTVA